MEELQFTEEQKQAIIREHFVRNGLKTGAILKAKYGSEHFRRMGKLGALKRWENKEKNSVDN